MRSNWIQKLNISSFGNKYCNACKLYFKSIVYFLKDAYEGKYKGKYSVGKLPDKELVTCYTEKKVTNMCT